MSLGDPFSKSGGEEQARWSRELSCTGTATSTPIRRHGDPLVSSQLGFEGCHTLYESFRRGVSTNPMGPCLGFRAVSSSGFATPYIYCSYSEVLARVDAIAAGLQAMKLVDPNEDGMKLVGIYMKNCMEWTIAEYATYSIGGVTVPFYDTLGPDTIQYILEHTNLSVCICTRNQLQALCDAFTNGNCPNFKTVVVVDGVTPEAAELASSHNINLTSLAKVETLGAQYISTNRAQPHEPPSPLDVATFCYTSGTTGNPKGALLTHQNFLSAASGLAATLSEELAFGSTDRHLSYLPMPHIFERITQSQMLFNGASIAFFRGDPTKLIEDIQACRPTFLPVAPRVLNKIYDKIMNGINAAGGTKKKLFDAALAAKMKGLKRGHLKHAFYDALIFNKIKKALGMDCLRVVVSGSAPLSPNVMYFFRCLLGICVQEGYGQTEGTAAATLTSLDDISTVGHVGAPIGCCEIKLVDVPEMKYLSSDTSHRGMPCRGRGEIWVRGPSVFAGYYKDEEKTKETVDEKGWLQSGDIGLWKTDGNLQIIDRKKNIFKLAQGEYIAVEKIENVVTQSLMIGQVFVYGDSFQSALVAIVVPDEEALDKWATDSGIGASSIVELCKTKELYNVILGDIQKIAKKNSLLGFETPKAIYLEPEPFTVENDLVTPTFKLKRHQLKEKYETKIVELYAAMPPPPSKL